MEKLRTSIKQFDRVAVALSGGSDSALIAREAVAAIGPGRVLGLTAHTGCMPARRLFLAQRIAALVGIEHHVLPVESVTGNELQQNGPQRCVQCRRHTLQAVLDEAWVHGCTAVLDGRHMDDQHHATFQVAEKLTMFSPYCECGMGEAQLCMLRGDVPQELPGDSCLYSRFPEGMPIRTDLAYGLDFAENALRAAGYAAVQLHVASRGALQAGLALQLVAPRAGMERLLQDWDDIIPQVETHVGKLEAMSPIAAEDFFQRS